MRLLRNAYTRRASGFQRKRSGRNSCSNRDGNSRNWPRNARVSGNGPSRRRARRATSALRFTRPRLSLCIITHPK